MSTLRYAWIILGLLFSLITTANAAVLLEKVTYPGFVMQEYAISSQCTLSDSGQLTVQYQLGSLTSKRILPVKLSLAAIKAAIDAAALGKITSNSFPVDVPTKIYRAYQIQATGIKPKQILLYEANGGSGTEKINDASAATTLRNFIDVNCKSAVGN